MGKQTTKSFDEYLKEQLQDPWESADYLNVVLEERNESALMIALRHVVDALGVGSVAEKAGLNRENLYRMLSEKGNPRLSSFFGVLEAVGLRLAIEPASAMTIRRDEVYEASSNVYEALTTTLASSAYQIIDNSQIQNHTLNQFEESEDEIIATAA